MGNSLLWLWHRWSLRHYESWRVVYSDGSVSLPLRREDAETRARLFDGQQIVWARDSHGDLLHRDAFAKYDTRVVK